MSVPRSGPGGSAGAALSLGESKRSSHELAEQALAGYCVDRHDHGVGVGLAVEIDNEPKQVEVQRSEDQLEHLAGLRLRLGGARGQ